MTTSMPNEDKRIGLIAGNGRFPIIFADNAKKLGYSVSAVAHEGETEPELEQHVDSIHWIKIGQLNKLINAFKSDNVKHVVMLGGIKKTHVFTTVRPDLRAWPCSHGWRSGRTTTSCGKLPRKSSGKGLRFASPPSVLRGFSSKKGRLTSREPSKKEWDRYSIWLGDGLRNRASRYRSVRRDQRQSRGGSRSGRRDRWRDQARWRIGERRSGRGETVQAATGSPIRFAGRRASNDRGDGIGEGHGLGRGSRANRDAWIGTCSWRKHARPALPWSGSNILNRLRRK